MVIKNERREIENTKSYQKMFLEELKELDKKVADCRDQIINLQRREKELKEIFEEKINSFISKKQESLVKFHPHHISNHKLRVEKKYHNNFFGNNPHGDYSLYLNCLDCHKTVPVCSIKEPEEKELDDPYQQFLREKEKEKKENDPSSYNPAYFNGALLYDTYALILKLIGNDDYRRFNLKLLSALDICPIYSDCKILTPIAKKWEEDVKNFLQEN